MEDPDHVQIDVVVTPTEGSTSTLVASKKHFVPPTDCLPGRLAQPLPVDAGVRDTMHERVSNACDSINNDQYIQTLKSFTCLTCTNYAGDPDHLDHVCYNCLFNGRKERGVKDYYVDQRLVAALAKSVDTTKILCVGENNAFCACAKCEKARFHNAM